MKHRRPQFNPIEQRLGRFIFSITTPRRPMRWKTWARGAWAFKSVNSDYKHCGFRLLGVEFSVRYQCV